MYGAKINIKTRNAIAACELFLTPVRRIQCENRLYPYTQYHHVEALVPHKCGTSGTKWDKWDNVCCKSTT